MFYVYIIYVLICITLCIILLLYMYAVICPCRHNSVMIAMPHILQLDDCLCGGMVLSQFYSWARFHIHDTSSVSNPCDTVTWMT